MAELLRHFFDQQLIRAICYSDHDMWDAYCWSDESPMTTTVLTDWDQILSVSSTGSCYWVQVRNHRQWYWGERNLDSFSFILTPELLNLGSLSKVHQLMCSAMPEASPVCYKLNLSGACISFCFFVIPKRGNLIVFHSWETRVVYGYKSRQLLGPWSSLKVQYVYGPFS